MTRPRPRPHFAFLISVVLLSIWACDSSTSPEGAASISLGSVNPELIVGGELQLVAMVLSSTGSIIPGGQVTWSSSNPLVAPVSASGLVRALSTGTATIRAQSGGLSSEVTLTIQAGECSGETVGSLGFDEPRTGTLGIDSCVLFGAERAEGWAVDLSSPAMIRIEATASTFTPFLMLTDPAMNALAWGFWSGELSSWLAVDLPAGSYVVWVIRSEGEPDGEYDLLMRQSRACNADTLDRSLQPGDRVSRTLGQDDCLFPDTPGFPAVGYGLQLTESTGLRLDLMSSEIDAFLLVTDAQMQVLWWDDDSGDGYDARIVRRFPAGEYIVWATSWNGAQGSFQLSISEVEIELCPSVGHLALDASVTGVLSGASCSSLEGRFQAPWSLTLSDSTTIQIDLTSSQFDAFLVLEDEDGTWLASDDDGGTGLNSRLVYAAGPGAYRVVVTTYWEWETGSYQLSARTLEGGVMASADPLPAFDPEVLRKSKKR